MKSALLLLALPCVVPLAWADSAADSALGLYKSGRISEAEAAFRKIVAANPNNAEACNGLGLAISHSGRDRAWEDSLPWFEKAVTLAPNDGECQAGYGDACFHIAQTRRSLIYALRGRDALGKAVAIDPGLLDARGELMQFFAESPWPLGGAGDAMEQAAEIARRDRTLGLNAYLRLAAIFEQARRRSAAQDACTAALGLDPSNVEARAALARLGAS